MSQHSNILKHEISAGIADGLSAKRIVERIQRLLEVMESDENTVNNALVDANNTAKWMRAQKNELYGVTHDQLDHFITHTDRWVDANNTAKYMSGLTFFNS